MAIKTANFKQAKISYSDSGKGRTIVLLHGFLGAHNIWDKYTKALSKKYRVLAINLPGHANSPCIGYTHSMEMLAQSVKAVCDKAGVRRYIIAGHSMGGYVALAFAELFPNNVSGLCLIHTTAYADSEEKISDRNRLIDLVKNGKTTLVTNLITNLFTEEKKERIGLVINHAQSIADNTPNQGIINSLEGMKTRKSRELILKTVEYPVFFVFGKLDGAITEDAMFSQIGLCKYPFVVMLENEGHMGFIEEPKQVLTQLQAFVSKCFRKKFN